MPGHVNNAVVLGPRNGTSTHTVAPSGAVLSGTAFAPTPGRLLLCIAAGAVTSTTPVGWTRHPNGFAVGNTGLYLWWRVAAGTSDDQVVTTHNGSNWPCVFHFIEFSAGSTFVDVESTAGAPNGGGGPTLSGLSGSLWHGGAASQSVDNAAQQASFTWNVGAELVDASVGYLDTEGVNYSAVYVADSGSASRQFAATSTKNASTERIVFAVNAVADAAPAGAPPGVTIMLEDNSVLLLNEQTRMVTE